MDLFNKKLLEELRGEIADLKFEIEKLKREKESKSKEFETYKSEIQNLILDNQNLNLSNSPNIKETLSKESHKYKLMFLLNSKNEDAIKAINEYLEYFASKNSLTNFQFDDIVDYKHSFEIEKNDSVSSKREIQKYYSAAFDPKNNIETTDIDGVVRVVENKINYQYLVESKSNSKDLRRDILLLDFEDYKDSSNATFFVKVFDINHQNGAFLLSCCIKTLQLEMHERQQRKIRALRNAL